MLKGGGGIRQPKEHDCSFEQTKVGLKGSFPFIPSLDVDIVEIIEFGKINKPRKPQIITLRFTDNSGHTDDIAHR